LFRRGRVGGRVLLAAFLICGGGATLVAGSAGASMGAAITLWGALLVVGATLDWTRDSLLSRALAATDALDVVARKGLIGAVLGMGAALATRDARPSLLGAG